MNIYYRENKEDLLEFNNTNLFKGVAECENITKEVYDNEMLVLNFVVLGNENDDILKINYEVDGLATNLDKNNLPSDVKIVTVYNNDIVGADGKKIDSDLIISNEKYLSIFIGIDTSYLAKSSVVEIHFNATDSKTIKINLKKKGHFLHNKGADDIDTLARLDWLNSKIFLNNKKSFIYNDIVIDGNILKLTGKTVEISKEGYIKNVLSYIDDNFNYSDNIEGKLLDGGIYLNVEDNVEYRDLKIEQNKANVTIDSIGEGDNIIIKNHADVKYEGTFIYNIEILAKNDVSIEVEQISAFSDYASKYMSGLGSNGHFNPFRFKWNDNYQDSLFIGNINVGARIKWLDENYKQPLTKNLYKYSPISVPNETWANNGLGGIDVVSEKNRARVTTYSGKMDMKAGEVKVFKFEVNLTPFHEINLKKHFKNKYFQYETMDKVSIKKAINTADKYQSNIINIHPGNDTYPYINYPFKEIDKVKKFIKDADDKDMGVNVYYNFKDLSYKANEIFPFISMNDEIVFNNKTDIKSNANEDIRSKVGKDIIISNKNNFNTENHKGETDYAVIINPNSRYNNYYVESVNWLAKELGIKGIHLEDNTLDRTTIERVRKALDRYGADIELFIQKGSKSNRTSTINNNMNLIPFVDSLIIDTNNNYKNMSPEAILTDVSGLIYGVTSELMDGDPFISMLYGMSNRFGYNINNSKKLRKLWDKFDIKNSEMVGFWSKDALIAKDEGVKITYYKKDKKILICIFNFNNYPAIFNVDYKGLEIDGKLKSYPMSKLIMKQKFSQNSNILLYNKCGVFLLGDLK